jgi:hypothetical protein
MIRIAAYTLAVLAAAWLGALAAELTCNARAAQAQWERLK